MKFLMLILPLYVFQDLPFKPKEEFEIKLDYQFKQRPQADHNSVNLGETRKEYERRTSMALLPYLVLKIQLLELQQANRIRIANNLSNAMVSKKVQEGTVVSLDVGFTDDAKDRVTPHEYIITFLSADKKELNKVVIHIEEDGTFLVNKEKRGKF